MITLPSFFSALHLGKYKDWQLQNVGKVGTGFNDKMQKEVIAIFKPLVRDQPAFGQVPEYNKPSRFRRNPPRVQVTWLDAELVCEINFSEVTQDGVFRHPSFLGISEDKTATDVVIETASHTGDTVQVAQNTGSRQKQIVEPPQKSEGKTLFNPKEKTQCKRLQGHELKFTNLDKLYWPDEKITKRGMLNDYYQVAPYILPYLKGRLESLNRHPGGIKGSSFYQKDVTRKVPEWMSTYKYRSGEDSEDKNYLVANEPATLLYMTSLGAVEINPWSSAVDNPDDPTWCVIDLDPAEKTPFEQVIHAAQFTKSVLDGLGPPSYPKTSGSTGIHIYIPLGGKYSYEQSKEFACIIVTLVHEQRLILQSLKALVD